MLSLMDELNHPFDRNLRKGDKCVDNQRSNELLHLILDQQANTEQIKFFNNHISNCMPCFQNFKVEKALRHILKTKIEKKTVPVDLVESIRLKIKQTV
jgi:anti-sigma factor (TIGR02949 family)